MAALYAPGGFVITLWDLSYLDSMVAHVFYLILRYLPVPVQYSTVNPQPEKNP